MLAAASPLRGQADSVTVVAGAEYAAGGLKVLLQGRGYRDLWTAPTRVSVLDLGSFAGGLSPLQRGEGKQTQSLRFRGRDGRAYNFRSVNKDQTGGLHPDFQNTLVDRIAQDQVSAKHPTGALIATALLEAAGVLHPGPALYVMPDDPRLGEFRAEFAGMLGTLEVHPDEGEGGRSGFAGAERVAGTERLLEQLEESPEHRVDARAFLRARLMDFFFGDWDRHPDQWRWARFDRGGAHRWVAVPEDRDNALSHYDGLLVNLVRQHGAGLVSFDTDYPNLYALTANAQELDRRLLAELPREAFDSIAADLQRRLGDAVIERAVANAPPEHHALRGAELIRKLQARRAGLPGIARHFHEQLAVEVDVRATDEPELARVDRLPDGSVELRLFAGEEGSPAPEPYFRRRFLPGETREVRLYLRGGDDRVVVRGGAGESPLVRVIGGGGDDLLVDSAQARGRSWSIAFYDHRGDNRVVPERGLTIDTREFTLPEPPPTGFNENTPAHRDWGAQTRWFHPRAEWRSNIGPVVGVGPRLTRFGFRRVPYARQVTAQALYAPLSTRFGLEVNGDFRRTASRSRLSVLAHATQLEVTRFHGFGNETPAGERSDHYKVWATEFRLEPLYHLGLSEDLELFAGPVLQYTRPELEDGGPADRLRPFGSEDFGRLGVRVGADLDTRDLVTFPRRGVFTFLRATAFGAAWDVPEAFGSVDALAATYLPLPLESTLAMRAGGRTAWGGYPLQGAAFLGGSGSLRGYPNQRFAGDAALFGSLELRSFLTRFNFISRGDLGVLALADAGRVFLEGESSATWHTGVGGGVWVGILDRTRTLSLAFVRGEESSLYLSFGMPF